MQMKYDPFNNAQLFNYKTDLPIKFLYQNFEFLDETRLFSSF